MAYLRLLWMYYDTEKPLPNTPDVLALKIGCEESSVLLLLKSFFIQQGDEWRHLRCDQEIKGYHDYIASQRAKGALGGRPKKSQGKPAALPEVSHGKPGVNPNQYPLTSNQETNTHVPDGTGAKAPDGFDLFWGAYPKKVGKPAALKAFKAAKLNGCLETVLKDVTEKAQSESWTKQNGQFIPNPATYLNQRRWEDSFPTGQPNIFAGSI